MPNSMLDGALWMVMRYRGNEARWCLGGILQPLRSDEGQQGGRGVDRSNPRPARIAEHNNLSPSSSPPSCSLAETLHNSQGPCKHRGSRSKIWRSTSCQHHTFRPACLPACSSAFCSHTAQASAHCFKVDHCRGVGPPPLGSPSRRVAALLPLRLPTCLPGWLAVLL